MKPATRHSSRSDTSAGATQQQGQGHSRAVGVGRKHTLEARHIGLEEEGGRKAEAGGARFVVGAVFHAVRVKVAAGEVGTRFGPGLRIEGRFVGGFSFVGV